jgi:hypothetical protein
VTTVKDQGVVTTVKYQYKSNTVTPEEFIAPLSKGFMRTETQKWRDYEKGINSKPQVVILNKEFMNAKDSEGRTVLADPKITQKQIMDAAEAVVRNWRPEGDLQEEIKKFNLKQFRRRKLGDYIITYNFRHSRAFFDKLKKAKPPVLRGAGFTDRGHVKAAVRYHSESEVDKLPDFEAWGKGSNKEAYLAARALKKTLKEKSSLLTPDIEHEWLVRVNREVTKIEGMEEFIMLVPEPAWKNRSKKEENELNATYTKLCTDFVNKFDDKTVLQIVHSKNMEQVISDKVTELLVGKRKVPGYNTRGKKKHRSKKRRVSIRTPKVGTPPPLRTSGGKFTSAMNIQAILDAKIKETVADNMGKGGALVYRTGRFAESVGVEKVMRSRQGMLTAFYTYMKAPYQTFERGYAQGSLRRDPRKLIAASIREIARETLNHKLQIRTRRV